MRLVVAITGATGTVYGIRLLEALRDAKVEAHLIVSKWGQQTLEHETTQSIDHVRSLAHRWYQPGDFAAAVSSGSFLTAGMVIIPCSMRTLASLACGLSENLIHRAAEVTLKERRKLVVAPRETPLTPIHLENMLKLANLGVVVMPPMPAFYSAPQSIDDLVTDFVARVLDQYGVDAPGMRRWDGGKVAPLRRTD
ncbi:MAG: UbiX family flavin prenyltransferase [Alphaproteobacteria bacterium]|nr:UbiX family flavin prenyltransferase [Alphaproteobacteria bacterium]